MMILEFFKSINIEAINKDHFINLPEWDINIWDNGSVWLENYWHRYESKYLGDMYWDDSMEKLQESWEKCLNNMYEYD